MSSCQLIVQDVVHKNMMFKLKPKLSYSFILMLFTLIIFVVVICYINKKEDKLYCVPTNAHKYLQLVEKYKVNNGSLKPEVLRAKLKKWNEDCRVWNWQVYGPVDPDTPIFVVRVHRDLERLQYLVASLAQVSDIHMALLIFSHGYYDENINELVRKIDFCMVLQLFYPNSVQLHPNKFPGMEDCTNQTNNTTSFCTERDPQSIEPKHHWWWTANFVFSQVAWAEKHKDMVIFIDEGSYVLPDFLYMLGVLKRSLTYISDASVLSFGRPLASDLDNNKLIVEAWRPPFDKGLAFNRTTWQKISKLSTFYCQYDDTSWSYSLMHLFEQFRGGRAVMVACMAPRVVSTGVFRSGRHALENFCEMTRRDQLFPKKVQAVMLFGYDGRPLIKPPKAPPNGNGGWSDQRDRLLCYNPLISTFIKDPSITTSTDYSTETLQSEQL